MTRPEPQEKSAHLALVSLGGTAAIILCLALIAIVTADAPGFPLLNIVAVATLPIIAAAFAFWFADRQQMIDRRYPRQRD